MVNELKQLLHNMLIENMASDHITYTISDQHEEGTYGRLIGNEYIVEISREGNERVCRITAEGLNFMSDKPKS